MFVNDSPSANIRIIRARRTSSAGRVRDRTRAVNSFRSEALTLKFVRVMPRASHDDWTTTVPIYLLQPTSGRIGNSLISQSSNGDKTVNVNGSLSVNGSLFLPNTTGPNTGVISI